MKDSEVEMTNAKAKKTVKSRALLMMMLAAPSVHASYEGMEIENSQGGEGVEKKFDYFNDNEKIDFQKIKLDVEQEDDTREKTPPYPYQVPTNLSMLIESKVDSFSGNGALQLPVASFIPLISPTYPMSFAQTENTAHSQNEENRGTDIKPLPLINQHITQARTEKKVIKKEASDLEEEEQGQGQGQEQEVHPSIREQSKNQKSVQKEEQIFKFEPFDLKDPPQEKKKTFTPEELIEVIHLQENQVMNLPGKDLLGMIRIQVLRTSEEEIQKIKEIFAEIYWGKTGLLEHDPCNNSGRIFSATSLEERRIFEAWKKEPSLWGMVTPNTLSLWRNQRRERGIKVFVPYLTAMGGRGAKDPVEHAFIQARQNIFEKRAPQLGSEINHIPISFAKQLEENNLLDIREKNKQKKIQEYGQEGERRKNAHWRQTKGETLLHNLLRHTDILEVLEFMGVRKDGQIQEILDRCNAGKVELNRLGNEELRYVFKQVLQATQEDQEILKGIFANLFFGKRGLSKSRTVTSDRLKRSNTFEENRLFLQFYENPTLENLLAPSWTYLWQICQNRAFITMEGTEKEFYLPSLRILFSKIRREFFKSVDQKLLKTMAPEFLAQLTPEKLEYLHQDALKTLGGGDDQDEDQEKDKAQEKDQEKEKEKNKNATKEEHKGQEDSDDEEGNTTSHKELENNEENDSSYHPTGKDKPQMIRPYQRPKRQQRYVKKENDAENEEENGTDEENDSAEKMQSEGLWSDKDYEDAYFKETLEMDRRRLLALLQEQITKLSKGPQQDQWKEYCADLFFGKRRCYDFAFDTSSPYRVDLILAPTQELLYQTWRDNPSLSTFLTFNPLVLWNNMLYTNAFNSFNYHCTETSMRNMSKEACTFMKAQKKIFEQLFSSKDDWRSLAFPLKFSPENLKNLKNLRMVKKGQKTREEELD